MKDWFNFYGWRFQVHFFPKFKIRLYFDSGIYKGQRINTRNLLGASIAKVLEGDPQNSISAEKVGKREEAAAPPLPAKEI